jgi:hypothetical protein
LQACFVVSEFYNTALVHCKAFPLFGGRGSDKSMDAAVEGLQGSAKNGGEVHLKCSRSVASVVVWLK